MNRILTEQEAQHLKAFHKYSNQKPPAGKRLDLAINAAVMEEVGYNSRQQSSRVRRTLQIMGLINEAGTRVTAKGQKFIK